ncbi:MAG: 5'/3'-nucleotidase SurE [Bacteroidales bacterium]|nr:5'/3'-nucleotidase SurE [Bacteroidales bacterium]
MANDKLILVTNDDGVDAPGVKKLTEIAQKFGKVLVVCPDGPRSGQSHAVTVNVPLRKKLILSEENIQIYSSNGTPVDCVKLALHNLLDVKPDLILSGINHGANASVNVFYSGTMAAALEGCMLNIPSLGFSTFEENYSYNLDIISSDIEKVIQRVIDNGLPHRTCLNVNFPYNYDPTKGLKVCRMGDAFWKEEFEERFDSHNTPYYWLKGTFTPIEEGEGTDIWAIKNGYAPIVPIMPDITAHHSIDELTQIFKI